MSKTPLFVRKQAGGVFTVVNEETTTGNIFWVDSGSSTGADSVGYGKNPDAPFLTWDYAVSQCTANNGDVIFLMPGHAETIITATTCATDVAGVKIVGLGEGSDRPTITLATAATATVAVSAANAFIKNVLFVCGLDGLNGGVTVTGNDATFVNCEFRDATNVEADIWIDASGDRLTLRNCFFNGYTSGDQQEAMVDLDSVDNALIEGCRFIGKVITACVNISVASTSLVVKKSTFYRATTTNLSLNVVDTATGSTWLVENCYDLGAGCSFSGGSGATIAKDDLSVIASDIVIIQSDVKLIADTSSDVVVIQSDLKIADALIDTIKSDLIITMSDVKVVNSDLKIADALIDAIKSDLIITMSDVKVVKSDLIITNAIVDTVASDVVVMDALIDTIKSDLIVVMSDVKAVNSDLIIVDAFIDTIKSDVIILQVGVEKLVRKEIADLTGFDTAAVFTVTGDVLVKVVGVVGATPVTSTSGTTTLSIGTQQAPAAIIGATTIDNTQLDATDVWVDTSPANDAEALVAAPWVAIGGGADIYLTRSVDDITAGALTLYCFWKALSSGGMVSAV